MEVPLACCPHCHGAVEDLAPLTQYIEEIPPIRPHVTRLVARSAKCPTCGEVRSTHPLQTSVGQGAAGVQLGPRALALAAMLNKKLGLTMRKTCSVQKQLCGLSITPTLITRGAAGMTLAAHDGDRLDDQLDCLDFPARPHELVDVTGAGDVVSAALAPSLAAGADIRVATWLANVAAGVKVGKFGAAAVSSEELLAALSVPVGCERKVMTRGQAAALAADLRQRGKRVVFTNGCFDLLHVGHVLYLEQSRSLGDALIMGVNSDASVGRLKGSSRPLQPEIDRTHIVASQASVDAVVVFDEDTPLELIQAIRPDVLSKGRDYKTKQKVVGWELVESWNGQVVLIDQVEGCSTSHLIKKAE